MINKATGTPMKYGELWARNERYRERMIEELLKMESEADLFPLKMFYQFIREGLFITCKKDRLDMTVSHDLNTFKCTFIGAAEIGFDRVFEKTSKIYEEEVEERTENLTEYV